MLKIIYAKNFLIKEQYGRFFLCELPEIFFYVFTVLKGGMWCFIYRIF